MFSLIITIISVILVTALALAVIYYGGDAFKQGAPAAAAGTLINQAIQIRAAGDIAESQNSGWPKDSPYFLPPFLASMPIPPRTAYVDGTPAATDWAYYAPGSGVHHFVLKDKISKDVCMAVNKKMGLEGIPAAWTGTDVIQCFGPGVPTGPNGALAYTFFFDPLGVSDVAATLVTQSITEATAAGVTNPTAGYPRLCPDNTTITSGVCSGEAPVAPDAPEVDKPGFMVITGSSGFGDAKIISNGFAEACPAGAIDVTGPNTTPLITNAGESFRVDGVQRSGWLVQPDYANIFDANLTRTWCIPAMKSEAFGSGVIAGASDGDVAGVALSPAVANANPMDYHYAANASTTVVGKGQSWTLLASSFEADLLHSGTDANPYMVGDKLAVGRGENLASTFFGNVPSLTYNGTTYSGEQGQILFSTYAPVTPPKFSFISPSGTDVMVDFPNTTVGKVSAPVTITVKNMGTGASAMSAPVLTGPFVLKSSNCPATLAFNASCTLTVAFAPTTGDYATGTLAIGTSNVGLDGWPLPAPTQGFWVFEAKFIYQQTAIDSWGFQPTCPANAINPNTGTPAAGLPAGENLNSDVLMQQWWTPRDGSYVLDGTDRLSRFYCVPAMSDEVNQNLGTLVSSSAGTVDHAFSPDTSDFVPPNANFPNIYTTGQAQISSTTFVASGISWTIASVTADTFASSYNIPGITEYFHVRKIAIGKTGKFAGTYYGGGPAFQNNGRNYTDAGFIHN